MFLHFFKPDIREWKVGERKLQFIMYLLNKFIALGLLEVAVYFVVIVLKYKLQLSFLNTEEYIQLISTVNYFYIAIGGILSGIYTYGNTQEWKFNQNQNQNMNQNIVAPNNNINISVAKKKTPSQDPDNEIFAPPKGEGG